MITHIRKSKGVIISFVRKYIVFIIVFTLALFIILSIVSDLGKILSNNKEILTIWISAFSFFWGLWIARDLYKTYKEKKVVAVFGFYEHLVTIIQRFKLQIAIFDGSGIKPKPAPILYLIWGDINARTGHVCSEEEFTMLRDLARDFLNYLSSVGGQVPPYDAIPSYNAWKENKQKLVEYLHNMMQIERIRKAFLYRKTEVEQRFSEIWEVLNFIELAALEQIRIFISDLSIATPSQTLHQTLQHTSPMPQKDEIPIKQASIEYSLSTFIDDIIIKTKQKLKKNLRFVVNIESTIPNALFGDKTVLYYVVESLLNNAIRVTDSGSVSLYINSDSIDYDTIRLTIEVKDSGTYMSQEDICKLLHDTYRFAQEKEIEYCGFNLAIIQSFIREIGGKLFIESKAGQGNTITVVLEHKIRHYKQLALVDRCNKVNALVVERRSLFANSITFSLNSLGVEYKLARSKAELHQSIISGSFGIVIIPEALYYMYSGMLDMLGTDARIVLLTETDVDASGMEIQSLTLPVYTLPLANTFNDIKNRSHLEKR